MLVRRRLLFLTRGLGDNVGALPGSPLRWMTRVSDNLTGVYERVRDDPEVREYIRLADEAMAAIGYTEHGMRHVTTVASNARMILERLGYSKEEAELAKLAGLLHDLGNMVARANHAQTGAILALHLLPRFGLSPLQAGVVMGAIGNHEEESAAALTPVGAALAIADKADVHRSRVRDYDPAIQDIHDDVNYACVESSLAVDSDDRTITLVLKVDTEIASVMEYFEIFTQRMLMSKRAAEFLSSEFRLVINGTELT